MGFMLWGRSTNWPDSSGTEWGKSTNWRDSSGTGSGSFIISLIRVYMW